MPRFVFFIFLAIGLAIAGGSGFYYASSWARAAEARDWPAARGVIHSIHVEDHSSRDSDGDTTTTHSPRIAYSYRVGNRTLRGERIWLTGNDFYNDRADAVAFVQDYQVGQSVPVVYDPARPGQSALLVENPPWQILLFTAFGLLWIAAGVGFRRMDAKPAQRRFGTCRSCGARLPFDEHVPMGAHPVAELAGVGPRFAGRSCPRCGGRDPLNSLRNKPGLIVFLVMFFGIWAVLLYLMFVF